MFPLFPDWSLPRVSCNQRLRAERTDSSEALMSDDIIQYTKLMIYVIQYVLSIIPMIMVIMIMII